MVTASGAGSAMAITSRGASSRTAVKRILIEGGFEVTNWPLGSLRFRPWRVEKSKTFFPTHELRLDLSG